MPQASRGCLRIISRKFRSKKWLILLLAIFTLICFTFNELLSFYLLLKCWRLKYAALNQICGSFFDRKYIGLACEKLCVRKELSLSDCPNLLFHHGKDYVFTAVDRGQNEYILKSRELQPPENFTINFNRHDRSLLIRSIREQIKATLQGTLELSSISNLIPYDKPIDVATLDDLDFATLLNLHDLIQDNEYMLSTILNNVDPLKSTAILPRVVSTCGNWYMVERSNFIIDYSYLDQTHPAEEKLLLSRKLMDFLVRFESLNMQLELCDVKFEHFATHRSNAPDSPAGDLLSYLNSSSLTLIDSDMIYHRENIKENIRAIADCQKDEDCDFNDCKGTCTRHSNGTSSCELSRRDDNLKRICRNLFFVEPFKVDQLHSANSLGLLTNLEPGLDGAVKLIYDLCFRDDLVDSRTNELYLLNERIERISNALAAL